MTWIAHYEPMLYEGQVNPTKRGFASADAAWEYITGTQVCDGCREELVPPITVENLRSTGCAAEWLVLEENKFDNAKSEEELMEAAGYKLVYKKPNIMTMPKSLLFDYHNYRKDMVCPLCNRTVWVGVDENGKESCCQKCYLESYE